MKGLLNAALTIEEVPAILILIQDFGIGTQTTNRGAEIAKSAFYNKKRMTAFRRMGRGATAVALVAGIIMMQLPLMAVDRMAVGEPEHEVCSDTSGVVEKDCVGPRLISCCVNHSHPASGREHFATNDPCDPAGCKDCPVSCCGGPLFGRLSSSLSPVHEIEVSDALISSVTVYPVFEPDDIFHPPCS
jgi:hypothetical protein